MACIACQCRGKAFTLVCRSAESMSGNIREERFERSIPVYRSLGRGGAASLGSPL